MAIDILSNSTTKRESTFFEQIPKDATDRIFYHCVNHDYVYMPENFIDKNDVRRRGGYYDETGKYYPFLKIIKEDADGIITCKYCEKEIILVEQPDVLITLKCPHCDASLEYLSEETVQTSSQKVDLTEIERPRLQEEPIYKDRFKLNKSFREYERDYARYGKRDFWSKPSNVVALILYGGSFLLIAIYAIVQLVSLFIEWLINYFNKFM